MRKIVLIASLAFGFLQIYAQSPHGDSFRVDCATCHNPESWAINIDTFRFDHDTTNFALEGIHLTVDCKTCHTTLIFDEAPSQCIACHSDVHNMSVGNDCARCHTSQNWLVDNIPELHEENGFPLVGAHDNLNCIDCHSSDTHLRFGRNGNDCASCHLEDYQNTESPDHQASNFSTNCIDCHDPLRNDWSTDIISNHDFFPLTKGHDIEDCKQCHLTDDFDDASPECLSCHQTDFNESVNPDHTELNLSTDCASCHTTDLEWKPASFDIHDEFYPLKGAHAAIANDCATCHNGDYINTPNTCVGCHQEDYDNTSNPDHSQAGFSTNCVDCHNETDWEASTFDHDSQYFPIYSGSHEGEWNDCVDCHTNPDNFAEFTCVTCHTKPETDNQHESTGGYLYESNACLVCHPTGETEAAFNHDATNFPLTGAHIGVDCLECHAEGYEGTSTACVDCHTEDFNNSSNPSHTDLGLSTNCVDCHTTEADWKPATFDVHDEYYELVGEHALVAHDCVGCHNGDYNNTPNSCVGCHQEDYDNTSNPNHVELAIPTDCVDCHKANTDWKPARFEIHDEYYRLLGAHYQIANDCATCHNGDYNNTPNTCVGCHQEEYDNTSNPNHSQVGFSTDCNLCHSEDDWIATKFNHDDTFPIYSGTHEGEWTECIDCHFNPDNYQEFTCITCHANPETDNQHKGVGGYTYESTACLACHPTGEAGDAAFDHDATNFPLTGAHIGVDCLDCHSEGFEGTSMECVDCHTTDFNESVNPNHTELNISTDCASCHTTEAGWKPATFDIHDNYYALTGEHTAIANDCATCHNGDYNNTPNTCVGCHQTDFNESVNPNHTELNISTDCASCHTTDADWKPASFDIHDDYYPLNGAHAAIANDCATCHNGDYNNTLNTCVGCHQTDFDNTTNPNHSQVGFSTDCASCHNETDWETANFDHDSQYFPIYSGSHQGEWNACVDCHTNPDNFAEFTCITCHTNPETDNEHDGVNGYIYESNACLACHPTGDSDSAFNHDDTNFPLTGEHLGVDCIDCHADGFEGTSTACVDCHTADFNASLNPNHTELNIPTDCASCHTTDADWKPASFDIHDDYYPLNGAHAVIANDCATCHNGDYNNTPNTCVGCHQTDFDNTTDPNHSQVGFSTDCASCHNEENWTPATFDHDSQYFPIYSGTHEGEWNDCVDCHTNPDNYAEFTCVTCHTNPETDNEHDGVNGYIYESNACLACHPTGDSDSAFDHDATNFPLTGAHIGVDCLDCHSDGFEGTSTACVDCHTADFNASLNPNHTELNISTDCASCHTTDADWKPASFDIHDDYYPLNGAHAVIANDCATCHNGNYNNTPNTCVGCHQTDFDNTTDPNHSQVGFSTDCASCHNEENWTPATFDHDSQYFPIYSGTHEGEWNDCVDCHTNPDNFAEFTCITCHTNPETDNEHNGVNGYIYESNACLACHPTGDSDSAFNHDETNFPLTGEHLGVDCIDCHADGFEGTSTACVDCHTADFNASLNPNHTELNIPTDCASCHTTDADWKPASFDIHNDYYPLNGAHAAIANDCATCHNGDYNNTPNTCVGCHQTDFDNTTNPNHSQVGFSTDCASCHNETDWETANFDHDSQYFPIYSGSHQGEWNACVDCHTNPDNFAEFTCITCHTNPETDNEHDGVNGYIYESNACLACHPTGDSDSAFDHDATNFPLTGAHIGVDCLDCHSDGFEGTSMECVDCHTTDFNTSVNPNHTELNIPTDCASCHTTDADWKPASFDIHDDYYPLNGAHAAIANDCATCHNGDYNNTPNTCVGCHQTDFDNTTDPNHSQVGFSTDCASCHNETDWETANFDHDSQYFPIYSGSHQGEWNACVDCHTNSDNFAEFTCITCHTNPETDNEHNGVNGYIYESNACLACHPTGDSDSAFDHDDTNFPLTGAHIGVDCIDCHADGFEGTSTACVDCHQADFDATTNPDHDAIGISTECIDCHTTDEGWMPATFANHDEYYALTGEHAAIANECATCHNGDYNNTPNTCVGCHQADFDATTNPDHDAIGISTECVDCHTTDADWMPATFDVHDDYYVLEGAHADIANDCVECHNGDYNDTPNTCVGCHQTDFDDTTEPDHSAAGFSTECVDCHNQTAWEPSTFDHDSQYFPIYSGSHEGEWDACVDCHTNPDNFAEFTCVTCHTNPETDDEHNGVNGYIYESNACLACHPTGDSDSAFNHDNTNFPLTGAHIGVDCLDCHGDGFEGTSTACVDCHTPDFNATTNPDHDAIGISTECIDCHTTDEGWMPATFANHDEYYALTGEHAAIANDCATCHNGDYNNTPNTCVGCHQADFDATNNPNHDAIGISTECVDCHTTDADWMPATFDVHDDYYVLEGAHADIANDCVECHNGDYNDTPNTCVGCHQTDFDNTTEPNHSQVGFSTDCASCHNEENWTPATFDHDSQYFPIYSGTHEGEWNDCVDCHINPDNFAEFTCVTCHTNPETDNEHDGVNGYIYESNACLACHPTGDSDSAFDHDATNFPLTGAHIGVDCLDCHSDGFEGTSTACVDCHTADFNASLNPNHTELNISTDCASCHTTDVDWKPASFDIHDDYYPLNGAHATIANDCATCHNGDYNNTPNTCVGCHQTDFDATTNPDHDAIGISTECVDCHTTDADWTPATFDVHDDYYILEGAHADIANNCVECHNGDYNDTPNTCVGCHQTDFDDTTEPNHSAAGFSTECVDCHNQTAWKPSTFDHDGLYFPIYSGSHEGEWDACVDCHTNSNDFTVFDCLGCHINPETDDEHDGVNGYIYESNACLACHPTGDSDNVFNHNDTNFPLTGAHIGVECLDCHADGFEGTSMECVDCHTPDFNATTNPDHDAIGISTACINCHTTEPDWMPATFDIHDDYYVLEGAHAAIANDCVECHNGDYNDTPNTCVGCHQTDFDDTTDPNHSAAGFPTDCLDCHNQTAWEPSSFDHDGQYFPIYSGGHQGEWDTCADCHTNPTDFSVFSCLGCHLEGPTANDHDDVNGYIYESSACLSCHPDGEE